MSYGAGFGAGMGMAAGQQAQNMLEEQMTRYKGLTEVYKSIASNPSAMPEVQKEAMRRMTLLANVDPRNPATLKPVKGFEDTSDIWKAHEALVKGDNVSQPSLQFNAAASGHPSPTMNQPTQSMQELTAPRPSGALPQPPQSAMNPSPQPNAALSMPPMGVQQAVGVQPGGANAPAPQTNQQSGGLQEQMLGQLKSQHGIEPNDAMSMAQRVAAAAGPPPPTSGMMTSEYKQWLEVKAELWKQEIEQYGLKRKIDMAFAGEATGAPEGSAADKRLKAQWRTDMALGKPLTRFQQTTINTHPAIFLPTTGEYFINGELVDAKTANRGGQGRWIKGYTADDPTPRMIWALPGEEATIFPAATVSSTTVMKDDIAGVSQSQTVRSASGGGGVPPAPAVGGGTAGPPAAGSIPGSNPLEVQSRSPHTWPGKVEPDYATRKMYTTNPTLAKKYGAAVRGLSHVGRILDHVEEFQRKYKHAPTGPVIGRIEEFLNRVGWGDAINSISNVLGMHNKGEISSEEGAAVINGVNQRLAATAEQLAEEARKNPHDSGAQSAAELFAGIVTLTRSLNGLELISMSGSGNGITRLYEMMERALLNPYQDPNLLRGHGREVGFLFTEVVKETLNGRGQGWPDLDPEIRRHMRKINLERQIPGYEHWEPQLPDGKVTETGAPKEYKMRAFNKATGKRIGSNDEGNTWYDIETGQPIGPSGAVSPPKQ